MDRMADAGAGTVAMLGSGSWATALVKLLSEHKLRVQWWVRKEEDAAHIRHYRHNPKYLSDVQVNLKKVRPTSDLGEALDGADMAIVAIPAAFVKPGLGKLPHGAFDGKVVVSAVKGLIPDAQLLVTDWLEDAHGVRKEMMAVIAGPCHAEEVALEKQSYLTLAAHPGGEAAAGLLAERLTCRYLTATLSDDLYGVEYCAVMKNVVAIACGISHGLGYGDNFMAVLVSNALVEMAAFLEETYPAKRNLYGSAYLGDVMVTAYSQFSRNRLFGNMLGRGYSVQAAQVEMNMVAEGYYAIGALMPLVRKKGLEMPILEAVHQICYMKAQPAEIFKVLKMRLR